MHVSPDVDADQRSRERMGAYRLQKGYSTVLYTTTTTILQKDGGTKLKSGVKSIAAALPGTNARLR
jgi:hypothetical protein